jgi:small conductance mechanosensitive channel
MLLVMNSWVVNKDAKLTKENLKAMRHARTVLWPRLYTIGIVLLSLSSQTPSILAQEAKSRADQSPSSRADEVSTSRNQDPMPPAPLDAQVVRTQAGSKTSALSASKVAQAPAPSQTDVTKMTEAEKIALLRRLVLTNRKELDQLKRKRDSRREDSEAQKTFEKLDDQLKEKRKALQDAEKKGAAQQVSDLTREIARLQQPWQIAKDRFDLDLRERKTINERIAILEESIKNDEERLQRHLGNVEEKKSGTQSSTEPDALTRTPSPLSEKPTTAPNPDTATTGVPAETATKSAPAVVSPSKPVAPGTPAIPGFPVGVAARKEESSDTARKADQPLSKELIKAEEQLKAKSDEVSKIERQTESLEQRLQRVDQSIKLEKDLLETAQLRAKNAQESQELFCRQSDEKVKAGAPDAEVNALRQQGAEAENRLQEALDEVKQHEDQLTELNDERNLVLNAQRSVIQRTEAAKKELARAQNQVLRLQNPFALPNVLRWIASHGPIIIGTLLAMLFLHWSMGKVSRRIVGLVSRRGMRGSKAERENRANTLVSVFHNAATLAIFIGGILMIFDEAGVPVGPLLGGAAVLGLAVAFGAQNLIRDYFYGFMILLENQYKLNDVVKIGDHSGQVEQITLRMTALRDQEGNLHFLPNGGITSVINMTHGWSRALFNIGIAYGEDVDRVMEVITELGEEMRKDPQFRLLILEDLTMLGVDGFADSSVTISFYIKTLPLQQWSVKREFLRRLKKRFDELGIEIPFPYRTLIHRTDGASSMDLVQALARDGRDRNDSPN